MSLLNGWGVYGLWGALSVVCFLLTGPHRRLPFVRSPRQVGPMTGRRRGGDHARSRTRWRAHPVRRLCSYVAVACLLFSDLGRVICVLVAGVVAIIVMLRAGRRAALPAGIRMGLAAASGGVGIALLMTADGGWRYLG